MSNSAPLSPLAAFDQGLRRRHGVDLIGGVDEAGRGALAGPVVAAAVVLGPEASLPGVNDSKALQADRREAMVPLILGGARAVGLGLATAQEIDRINILQATHLAAARALAGLGEAPHLLVTDYLKLRGAPAPVLPIKKGDATSLAVAAASVLAKVARDRLMTLLDGDHPGYGFARHKGYGTAAHLAALRTLGASSVHRLTFAGVCWFGEGTGVALQGEGDAGLATGSESIRLVELLANGV
jgi:ribonuclease HII